MTAPGHPDQSADDPDERRRRGLRRTRAIAAGVGAAALVGTGVLTVHFTTAQTQTATAQSGTSTQQSSGTVSSSQQLPTSGGSGTVHASSGGS